VCFGDWEDCARLRFDELYTPLILQLSNVKSSLQNVISPVITLHSPDFHNYMRLSGILLSESYAFSFSSMPYQSYLPITPDPSVNEYQSQKLFPYFFVHLVLSSSNVRELEDNTTSSQTSVDLRVSVESVVNTTSLFLVQNNLQSLASVFLGTNTLADNLNWVDEVTEDGIVDSSESSGTRTLLSLGGTGSVAALWSGKNAASSEDYDVTVRELLFELTGETLLNSVEACKGWDGDKDDNSLLAVANFNLSGMDELKWAESGFQVCGVGLKVVESTSDAGLEL